MGEHKEREMEFQRERVYTALNADELHEGDKVIVADDLVTLKHCVKDSSPIDTIRMIGEEDYIYRFGVKDNTATFALAYLVERKENCTNCGEGKWDVEHKKIYCDPAQCANGNVVFRNQEIEVCEYWKPKTEHDCQSCKYKNCGFKDFNTKNECDRWEAEVKAEPHYRPFRDTDELIKVWNAKIGTLNWGTDGDLTMPHIWVKKHDDTDRGKLIISFSNNGCSVIDVDEIEVLLWEDLFNIYTFLDGSPCGVEE